MSDKREGGCERVGRGSGSLEKEPGKEQGSSVKESLRGTLEIQS